MRYKLLALLLFAVGAALIMSSAPVTAAPEGPGTLTVVEKSTCVPTPCQVFFFNGTGGIGDFALTGSRFDRTSDSADFGLAAGVYKVTQYGNDYYPLSNISCTSDQRRLTVQRSGGVVLVDLRAGETVICTFSNDPQPTATPTPTTTATPVATVTPVPTATAVTAPTATAVPPQVIVVNVPAAVVPTAAVPVAAVVSAIRPPNTGDGGLR